LDPSWPLDINGDVQSFVATYSSLGSSSLLLALSLGVALSNLLSQSDLGLGGRSFLDLLLRLRLTAGIPVILDEGFKK
jgi:hypothetical protein